MSSYRRSVMKATREQSEPLSRDASSPSTDVPRDDPEGGTGSCLEPGEFKLLTVYPSEDVTSDVESAISVARYEETEYYALSYVWGDPQRTKAIRINGKLKSVTINLESALRRLRGANSELLIWADAVCINQDDIEERNSQVQQMGSIYRHADCVLAWLGESDDDSRLAFDKLRKWGETFLDEIDACPSLLDRQIVADSVDDPQMEDIVQSMDGIFDEEVWAALVKLARRPWWTRAWILQECVLAQRIGLICGEDVLTWECLIASRLAHWAFLISYKDTTVDLSNTRSLIADFSRSGIVELYKCWDRYQGRQALSRPHWIDVLRLASSRDATEPRDRLFSALGLQPDMDKPLLEVDYSKNLAEVYATLSRALLLLPAGQDSSGGDWHASPGTLANAAVGDRDWFKPDAIESLPTWANDWSKSERSEALVSSTCFRASGRYIKNSVEFLNPDSMLIQGTVLDIVSSVMEPDAKSANVQYMDKKTWSTAGLSDQGLYPSGITRLEAFFRTVTQDTTAIGRRMNDDLDVVYTYIARFLLGMARGVHADDHVITDAELSQAAEALLFSRTNCGLGSFFSNGCNGFPTWPATLDFQDAAEQGTGVSISTSRARRFFNTEKGYMGTTNGIAKTGDLVCVLHGGNSPYVLRRIEQGYIIVGDAYVHGFMDGEAIDAVDAGLLTQQDFIIH